MAVDRIVELLRISLELAASAVIFSVRGLHFLQKLFNWSGEKYAQLNGSEWFLNPHFSTLLHAFPE